LIGNQRSMVDSVAYTFGVPVNLTSSDFTMATFSPTHSGPASPASTYPGLSLTSLDNGSIWVVTWVSGGGTGGTVTGHSIADGVYDLVLNNSDRSSDRFYRLYGDITGFSSGTARVNNLDSAQFSNAYLKSTGTSGYLAGLDANADGRVNNIDSANFSNRYLSTWSGFTPTI
jgi:hypothetical protein